VGADDLEGTLSLTAEAPLEGALALEGVAVLAGAGAFPLLLDLPLFLFALLSSCRGSTSLALVFCTLTLLPGGLL
jgi:hypothetical protein